MSSINEKMRKKIQKIIYGDLDLWKEHINDLNTKKIDVNTFKQHYVEFLQKIEENVVQFTLFFLKKESQLVANEILEDNLEKTALLETIVEFLSYPSEEEFVSGGIIRKKFPPFVSISPTKDEKSLIYPASETE
jgi:hypothetical protein